MVLGISSSIPQDHGVPSSRLPLCTIAGKRFRRGLTSAPSLLFMESITARVKACPSGL